ncbi:hypothetical protein KGF56_003546 [Candida oxycetoniae]|uniref:Uncharacterized protein n=1 Tax=Candida oxycetoniae TaxID=497107 RepID=A0AAI9SVI5_9ASCO|nr:uncharacterized protein KGF56_003546 [Candida oxycetoniae]KAI3403619.2 hypothetical protein KGF56_003546 [Candida oxycetoniae]
MIRPGWQSLMQRSVSPIFVTQRLGLRFAGHSKWANIKHDKAKNDAKKSKEATFMVTRIESCVRTGGKEGNATLESLLEKAKKLNVSKQVVQNAIKRGAGEIEGSAIQNEVSYEFIGPGGVAIIVAALTDNKARTIMRVKTALAYFSASMSPCNYMFSKKGEILFKPGKDGDNQSSDEVLELALELGADDFEELDLDDDFKPNLKHKVYRLICEPGDIYSICNQLTSKGYKLHDSTVRYLAEKDVQVQFPEEHSKGFLRAIDNLDQTPEVTDYFTNIENEHESRIQSSLS